MKRNIELALKYRNMLCEVCGSIKANGHHIKSFGSSQIDEDWNMIALCFNCHRQIHDIGLVRFVKRYPKIKNILKEKGWEYNEYANKYLNDLCDFS